MVDAVLYFEGDRSHTYRIVRAVKNRFGSTNEIGVFDMMEDGLREVPNPSELFLASRPNGVSGSCATCVIEGNRPIIAEVQALVVPTAFPSPRRTADGLDYNRMCLLLAVLRKAARTPLFRKRRLLERGRRVSPRRTRDRRGYRDCADIEHPRHSRAAGRYRGRRDRTCRRDTLGQNRQAARRRGRASRFCEDRTPVVFGKGSREYRMHTAAQRL